MILSGGTVNSPQLLQLSGIGPAPLLQSLGIEVRHALPGVGENLRDHYAPRFVARVKNAETINEKSHGLKLVGEVLKYAVARKGILALNPTLIYVFWKSDERVDNYDLQLTFTPASYKEGVQSTLDDFPGMTIASWQQRPDSIGYIRARSADPFEHPIIQPNYLVGRERPAGAAGRHEARPPPARTRKPLSKFYDREEFPGPTVAVRRRAAGAAKQRGTTTFHLMGTCRMAPDSDPTAVVDDQLRVRGLQGLRVVDASIMPTMPSANLNASVLMIAEKAADMIRGKPPLEAAVLKDGAMADAGPSPPSTPSPGWCRRRSRRCTRWSSPVGIFRPTSLPQLIEAMAGRDDEVNAGARRLARDRLAGTPDAGARMPRAGCRGGGPRHRRAARRGRRAAADRRGLPGACATTPRRPQRSIPWRRS